MTAVIGVSLGAAAPACGTHPATAPAPPSATAGSGSVSGSATGSGTGSVTGPEAGPSAARSAVTWSGWRGVRFGTPVREVHRRLGGSYAANPPSRGPCGDRVSTGTGMFTGAFSPHPHAVGTIEVVDGVAYPMGVRRSMTPAEVARHVRRAGLAVESHRQRSNGVLLSEDLVVGPHGHTLFFTHAVGSERIIRMALTVDRGVAVRQMRPNLC